MSHVYSAKQIAQLSVPRDADLPKHLRKGGRKLLQTGTSIMMGSKDEKIIYSSVQNSELQKDMEVFRKAALGRKVVDDVKKKQSKSSISLSWEGGSPSSEKAWQSTMRACNEDMVDHAANVEQVKTANPDVGSHITFNPNKITNDYSTSMCSDFPAYSEKDIQRSAHPKRVPGPIRSYVRLGDEDEPAEPEHFDTQATRDFREYTNAEQKESKGQPGDMYAGSNIRIGSLDEIPGRFNTTACLGNAGVEKAYKEGSVGKFKKQGAAVDIKRSAVRFGDEKLTYESTYKSDVSIVRDLSESRGNTYLPQGNRSRIQIGQRDVKVDYRSDAKMCFVDHSKRMAEASSGPVKPKIESKIVLGEQKGIEWISTASDKVNPALVPGAYTNVRDEGGYKGVPKASVRRKAAKEGRTLSSSSRGLAQGDAATNLDYSTTYRFGFDRGNEDFHDSKRKSSILDSTTRVSLGQDVVDNMYQTSYESGSGFDHDDRPKWDEIQAQAPDILGRVQLGALDQKLSYETTGFMEQPPPYEQLKAVKPVKGGAAKLGDDPVDYVTTKQINYRPYQFKAD